MMRYSGFTLIELSIVLVIIGLVAGGVMVGSTLVHQAELRATAAQVEMMITSHNTFRLKYNGLPGDIVNGTSFFSGTANGNGDGHYYYGIPNQNQESFAAWQQLSLAGLIKGSYNGSCCTWTSDVNGEGSPLGKDIGYTLQTGPGGAWGTRYGKKDLNHLYLGKLWTDPSRPNGGGILPIDAQNIDQKLDDGAASTGWVIGLQGWDGSVLYGCTNGVGATHYQGAPGSASYDLTSTLAGCNVLFYLEK